MPEIASKGGALPPLAPGSLFPEGAPAREDRLRLLVVGQAGLDLLPQVLRSLANLGLSPLSARQQRHEDATASLALELEPQGMVVAERAARSLSTLSGVRRVAYDEAGSGGLFQQDREKCSVAAK